LLVAAVAVLVQVVAAVQGATLSQHLHYWQELRMQ
jgi:hypothetical protein